MTLFPIVDSCGCETIMGHICHPSFVSAENWPPPAEQQPCNSHNMRGTVRGSANKNGPDPVRQHHVDQGLTPNQEGLS